MLYRLQDKQPRLIGSGHFIAPGAAIIGDCILHEGVSIWFNVVLRGDADTITIGAGSNIQDGSVLHADPGFPLVIGSNVTVGHKAMVHGCTVGDGSLIGINAVVLNGARIGRHCLIGANALVPEGMEVPDGAMVLGCPGRIKRMLTEEQRHAITVGAQHYVANGARYLAELERLDND